MKWECRWGPLHALVYTPTRGGGCVEIREHDELMSIVEMGAPSGSRTNAQLWQRLRVPRFAADQLNHCQLKTHTGTRPSPLGTWVHIAIG